jgi:hypothetical protein
LLTFLAPAPVTGPSGLNAALLLGVRGTVGGFMCVIVGLLGGGHGER